MSKQEQPHLTASLAAELSESLTTCHSPENKARAQAKFVALQDSKFDDLVQYALVCIELNALQHQHQTFIQIPHSKADLHMEQTLEQLGYQVKRLANVFGVVSKSYICPESPDPNVDYEVSWCPYASSAASDDSDDVICNTCAAVSRRGLQFA